jgi:hypothetical protein
MMKKILILAAIIGCCPTPDPEVFCLDPAHDGQACDLSEGGKGMCVESQCVPTPGPAKGAES